MKQGEKMGSDTIEMKVTGLSVDTMSNVPFLILKDEENLFSIPIWIGILEASSIATQLENIKLLRPMTHDLMKNIFLQMNILLNNIEITDLKENTYFALLNLTDISGKNYSIDCRPSDAIALALRFQAPILVRKEVIQKSRRVEIKEDEKPKTDEKDKWTEVLENLSPKDFGKYKM